MNFLDTQIIKEDDLRVIWGHGFYHGGLLGEGVVMASELIVMSSRVPRDTVQLYQYLQGKCPTGK